MGPCRCMHGNGFQEKVSDVWRTEEALRDVGNPFGPTLDCQVNQKCYTFRTCHTCKKKCADAIQYISAPRRLNFTTNIWRNLTLRVC